MFTCIVLNVASFFFSFSVSFSLFLFKYCQRSYAFERSDIPLGENYVLKLTYPFKVFFFSISGSSRVISVTAEYSGKSRVT